MKLYYNKTTGILGATATATTNVQKLTVKRYQDVEVELVPVTAGGIVELFGGDAEGLLVVKTVNDFSGSAKILDTTWDAPVIEGRGYVFAFVAVSTGIDTELGTTALKAFALEIVIVDDGKRIVLPTVQLVIENNYYREDEEVPGDVEPVYPPSSDVLTKSGNLAGLAAPAAARANLGIVAGALVNKVSVPANSAVAGAPGNFAVSAQYFYLYTGDGATHTWLRIFGANAF